MLILLLLLSKMQRFVLVWMIFYAVMTNDYEYVETDHRSLDCGVMRHSIAVFHLHILW